VAIGGWFAGCRELQEMHQAAWSAKFPGHPALNFARIFGLIWYAAANGSKNADFLRDFPN
jgi:hypothetical protein